MQRHRGVNDIIHEPSAGGRCRDEETTQEIRKEIKQDRKKSSKIAKRFARTTKNCDTTSNS